MVTSENSDDDNVRAARAVNVHDFVISLPQEYSIHVGGKVALISGGEAQRLQMPAPSRVPQRCLFLTSVHRNQVQVISLFTHLTRTNCTTTVLILRGMTYRLCVRDGGNIVEPLQLV